jgi:hypothetical protein
MMSSAASNVVYVDNFKFRVPKYLYNIVAPTIADGQAMRKPLRNAAFKHSSIPEKWPSIDVQSVFKHPHKHLQSAFKHVQTT